MTSTKRPPEEDTELLNRAMNAANGRRFELRFMRPYENSPLAERYETRRRAELSLLANLAFWTGCDRERMWRLFKRSELYQQKYERMPEYKQELLDATLEFIDDQYGE